MFLPLVDLGPPTKPGVQRCWPRALAKFESVRGQYSLSRKQIHGAFYQNPRAQQSNSRFKSTMVFRFFFFFSILLNASEFACVA